jgi:hypothetical protein
MEITEERNRASELSYTTDDEGNRLQSTLMRFQSLIQPHERLPSENVVSAKVHLPIAVCFARHLRNGRKREGRRWKAAPKVEKINHKILQ